jgi:coenzyme F420-reducing hydrogenase delta subunit
MAERDEFVPRITAFVCNWCTYAGADLAGTTRLHYPATVRIIRVPCSGRIDPLFILKAFEKGADGVLVSGCHPGDCHYSSGNYYARRRWTVFAKLLEFVGIEPERVSFTWVSASEGRKWAEVVGDVTERVKSVGPMKTFAAMTPARADVEGEDV